MAEETWHERSTRQAAAAARQQAAADKRTQSRPLAERIYGKTLADPDAARRAQIGSGIAKRSPGAKRR